MKIQVSANLMTKIISSSWLGEWSGTPFQREIHALYVSRKRKVEGSSFISIVFSSKYAKVTCFRRHTLCTHSASDFTNKVIN
jgi:hypothetical protein